MVPSGYLEIHKITMVQRFGHYWEEKKKFYSEASEAEAVQLKNKCKIDIYLENDHQNVCACSSSNG